MSQSQAAIDATDGLRVLLLASDAGGDMANHLRSGGHQVDVAVDNDSAFQSAAFSPECR